MKFKNISNKLIPFKFKGEWKNVKPNETIELGENAKSIKGLEEVKEEEVKSYLSEDDLNLMKKDELNDYGANIGLDEINTSMTKKEMIKAIVEFQNEED